MPLSLMSPIVCDDIAEIAMLKPNKVFLLRGNANEEIIVKADAVQAVHIKSASVAIKAIDPGVKMKVLAPLEVTALKDYAEQYQEIYAIIGAAFPNDPEKAAADSLQQLMIPQPATFMKMAKQTMMDLGEAFDQRALGNKGPIKQFVHMLKSPGGLEQLGKVIAADLYNGNCDRFAPYDPNYPAQPPLVAGGFSVQLDVLINPGNVVRVLNQGGAFYASLLDYVDPSSQFKDPTHTLASQEQLTPWPGRTLVDPKARHAFAKAVIKDLESVLHPKKSRFSLKTKLGGDAVKRLEAGMVDGAKAIKRALELKYNPNRWNTVPSVRDRYQMLAQIR